MVLQGQLLNIDKNGQQKRIGKEQKTRYGKRKTASLKCEAELTVCLQSALAVGKRGSALKFFEHLNKIACIHIPKPRRDIRNAVA